MNNLCKLINRERREISFPGRIYGYLSLCIDLKYKKNKINEIATVGLGNLPFVSKMTEKSTPEGVLHACWAFLKY